MTTVFADPRYQPRIQSTCHPVVPTWCWLTADGKGLRIECAQCGMLVIDFKLKSPIIRRYKSSDKKITK
jgi:hypothetical protein